MVVMIIIFKIEFLGGEFFLVRVVLLIRLYVKRVVFGIIIVVVKKLMKFNWLDLKGVVGCYVYV